MFIVWPLEEKKVAASDGKKDLKLTLIHFICAQAAQRRHSDVLVEGNERMQAILAFG
jgi:hypothetical protein